mmetsp:Transcript_44966/g.94345  ORF Transcript_44966/g.94345 Transcript_44966/m.94345 type:complete len:105 (+) Transcript_44966:376-690(+)
MQCLAWIHINAWGGNRSQRNATLSNNTAAPANSANNSGAENAQNTQQPQQAITIHANTDNDSYQCTTTTLWQSTIHTDTSTSSIHDGHAIVEPQPVTNQMTTMG